MQANVKNEIILVKEVLCGAKKSFTGWVSGWAMSPSPTSQTDPRLCVTAIWAVLLSSQPLQTLTAQQLSLFCTIFSYQTVRPPFRRCVPALRPSAASRHTGAFRSQRLVHAAPFLFCCSSSSSLRAFWLQLQPATSLSFKSMQALVQILRMVFKLCLSAPAGQSCGTARCPRGGGCPWKWQTQEWHKGAFCCQSWSKQCFEFLLRWLFHKGKNVLFLNNSRHFGKKL